MMAGKSRELDFMEITKADHAQMKSFLSLYGKLFIFGIDELECRCGKCTGGEVGNETNPEVRRYDQMHKSAPDRDRRVKRAAGNPAECVGHHRHGEADGQAVVEIARRGCE